MAEEIDQGYAQGSHPPLLPPRPPPFLEVTCKSLEKASRFAAGTKAGFAVSSINRKLGDGAPLVLHIEAVKDGEEPVSFGNDAVLVNYGKGWKLKTVTELDYAEYGGFPIGFGLEIKSAWKPYEMFLEVTCTRLGKASRFAAGTKAGFAVSLINRKLGDRAPRVLHIEAVKDGEEPVSFGNDVVLVDYGNRWKLKTVTELDYANYESGLSSSFEL